jgi:hypothetical protein
MKLRSSEDMCWSLAFPGAVKGVIVVLVFAVTAQVLVAQSAPHVPQGIVADWTDHHVLFPDSNDEAVMAQIRRDPRWTHNWYLRHREAWWPEHPREHGNPDEDSRRDWSVPLSATPLTSAFEPVFDFAFTIGSNTGYINLNTTDIGNGEFLATAGTLTLTGGQDAGTYTLYPGGPGNTGSPSGYFSFNDALYPAVNPVIDNQGLLFTKGTFEINIFSNGANNYEFYDNTGYNFTAMGQAVTLNPAPSGGETYPAKYVFDVTAAPSCTNDFVVIGIPATPASGGQANVVGLNNLYSTSPASAAPNCTTNGPTVMFSYASGTGQVPAFVTLSQNGKQLAYVENLTTGSSYFHVLTIGTTGTNGTSASAAVVPGAAGGNNAVDQRVLLSPDGGITNQSSTNAAYVRYSGNDSNDFAYVSTYTTAGTGSGYLYKIGNVFKPGSTPTILWSIAVNAIPSTPIYDEKANKVFFTDSNGRIDYVVDTGASPSVVYSAPFAAGTTSEYPVTIDETNQMVYATFNSNGTNAIVVQAPASMASSISVPVGTANTTYTAPHGVTANNAFFTGSGTPLLYVAGTGTGTLPTLYGIGFQSGGLLNPAGVTSAALATGAADSSPVTEFYNVTLNKDFLFVGVSNHCKATTGGGAAGCVMSLNITGGFPTINAGTTALAAAGGTSGIIIDNDSSITDAASIYYATKTGSTLVKATQSGLN